MSSRRCDSISACVVIPVFNHARTVAEVVKGCLAFASCVLVCDDGSTDGSGDRAREAGAEVQRHPANRGKGAALKTLFAEATKRGFRYAISLDADGQHYPDDLPAVVEAVTKNPGALVAGARDLIAAGAPGSSEFGRRFSNFWVWFESGARVDDSQCGLRAYPLPEATRLAGWRSSYDFEVEILLRAAWSGVPIVSAPVKVLYPKDRVTHFRPVLDNTRISLLNTATCIRLLLPLPLAPLIRERPRRPGLSGDDFRRWVWLGGAGPLFRLLAVLCALLGPWGVGLAGLLGLGVVPASIALLAASAVPFPVIAGLAFAFGYAETLLRRRALARAQADRQWTGASRGGALGHLIFVAVLKVLGPGPAYALLYPVAAWFVLFAPTARKHSADFFRRVKGTATPGDSYRHFLSLARTLLDRMIFAARGTKDFTYVEDGVEQILEASRNPRGSILLTAHVGNAELASGLLGARLHAPIALVAFEGEDAAVRAALERSGAAVKPRVLSVGQGELAALSILRALREGQVVAMQGDRAIDDRVVRVPFFGADAAFPIGPFVIAAISGAPLIATFNVQTAPRTYKLSAFAPVVYRFEKGDRDAQIKAWVADYAKKLEGLVRAHPAQWFNFFDFWK